MKFWIYGIYPQFTAHFNSITTMTSLPPYRAVIHARRPHQPRLNFPIPEQLQATRIRKPIRKYGG